jgi:hypothetical protein
VSILEAFSLSLDMTNDVSSTHSLSHLSLSAIYFVISPCTMLIRTSNKNIAAKQMVKMEDFRSCSLRVRERHCSGKPVRAAVATRMSVVGSNGKSGAFVRARDNEHDLRLPGARGALQEV